MKRMPAKPNIVIILWDCVRANNLPHYGYALNTTPHLLEMEKDFAIYQNAISCSYWTLPSITSLFTGMYPSSHGLLIDGDKLAPNLVSLPEILQRQGYYCAAFNRNPYVSGFTGLDRGFDRFFSNSKCIWDYLKKIEKKMNRKFSSDPTFNPADGGKAGRSSRLHWLKSLPDAFFDSGSAGLVRLFNLQLKRLNGKPFFIFFQAVEPHRPYRSPINYGTKYSSIAQLVRKILINQDHLAYVLGQTQISKAQFDILKKAYDSAILYCDDITHRICNALKANNLYDNTLIIVMADHGESIGEHDLLFHIWSLYDNLIKVPLFIKYPSDIAIRGALDKLVQNVDIMPTILTLLGLADQFGNHQAQGNCLLETGAVMRPQDIAISELIKPFGPDKIAFRKRLKKYDRRLLSLRTIDKKFIYSSAGDHEYYNLAQDPDEICNLYGKTSEYGSLHRQASHYYQNLNHYYQSNKERIEGEKVQQIEDEDIKQELMQLGYM